MLLESTITDKAKHIIQQKLIDVAKNHNVRILFAVESGSRAWGFPSTNSDYDVRFVYARQKDDYLSVKQYRDVIETDIGNESLLGVPLDLNGWDIRKALQPWITSGGLRGGEPAIRNSRMLGTRAEPSTCGLTIL